MGRVLRTTPPPTWRTGEGREHYLPEEFYFNDTPGFPLHTVARVTARLAARWADRYSAYLLARPAEHREGSLPEQDEARRDTVNELIDWLEERTDTLQKAALNLYQGSLPVLLQVDGIPGVLTLKPKEFAKLQAAWVREGLPRDLYYAAREQRTAIDPVKTHGGVVQVSQRYSPLRWARRQGASIEAPTIPSEEQRIAEFSEACWRFMEAVRLRLLQLSEAGRDLDRTEFDRLAALHEEVAQASLRARGGERLPGHSAS